MPRPHTALAFALVLPLARLCAQGAPSLAPGIRVRVARQVGTLTSIDSQTIVLRDEKGAVLSVTRKPDTPLEVSAGREACGGRCILIGAAGGAAVGALVGVGVNQSLGPTACEEGCGGIVLQSAAVGAAVGAIIGAVMRHERWTPVDIPPQVGVSPAGLRRIGLSLSFQF